MKGKSRTQKGITLVALIITIIVLLILAVVTIRAVQGDGIIAHAKDARDKYNEAQEKEKIILAQNEWQMVSTMGNQTFEDFMKEKLGEGKVEAGSNEDEIIVTLENGKIYNVKAEGTMNLYQPITEDYLNTVLSTTSNTKLLDKYGNKITLPAGFKIVVDNTSDPSKSTSYTKDTIDVTKGIVIEDVAENQFVWIPVGKIYTDKARTKANAKTITLGRYSDFTLDSNGNYIPVQPVDGKDITSEVPITIGTRNHIELQPTENGKGPNGNSIAKNINDFYSSSIFNGGYYIGRYEAGRVEDALVCRVNQELYNSISQIDASSKCKDMYISGKYTSDLVNSYAWDTAIIFIQTFGTEVDANTYASVNKSTGFRNTGLNPDKYCNIYDMSGNAMEWTTETCSIASAATRCGGAYNATANRCIRFTECTCSG